MFFTTEAALSMRVAAVADLHGLVLPAIPSCDLLLIAGDLGPRDWIVGLFAEWLDLLEYDVIGIAGNHDWLAVHEPELLRSLPWTYLEDETVRIGGHVIHGSPWTPPFMDWAFMLPEQQLAERWALIPDDTTILMAHGPPRGTLDHTERGAGVGSTALRDRLTHLDRLRLHVFGHVHEGRGEEVRAGRVFANVSLVDASYRPYTLEVPVFDVATTRALRDQQP